MGNLREETLEKRFYLKDSTHSDRNAMMFLSSERREARLWVYGLGFRVLQGIGAGVRQYKA